MSEEHVNGVPSKLEVIGLVQIGVEKGNATNVLVNTELGAEETLMLLHRASERVRFALTRAKLKAIAEEESRIVKLT